MASLYEINAEIESVIDTETGEILDPEKLEQLQMDRREKLRNIALLAKNKASDIQQFKEQEQLFAKRRKAAENTLAWCKATLQAELNGQKMEEAEFVVSYRPSESIEIDADAEIPAEFLKQREPDIDRMALKAVLKDGAEIPGIRLVRKSNIQIK
jgi:hypothetical protein